MGFQVFVLLSVLSFILNVTMAEDAVIGDVQLLPTANDDLFEVQVYYGDGLNPPSWVAICHDHSYLVHNVTCRQLGYKPAESASFISVRNSTEIKLFNVDCRKMSDASHILRCKYNVSQSSTGSDCSNMQALAINCDFNAPLPSYDGQVVLCPPQPVGITNRRSASFGVVGVRLHNKVLGISQPRPVAGNGKESQPLGGSEADAICRELGYTGVIPGSIATKSAYESLRPPYNFNHCFSAQNTVRDLPFRYIQNASWLSTDQVLKCTNLKDSQKCFGCCYDYPQNDCSDPACVTNTNDVVIHCGFDPSKAGKETGTAGSNLTCAFNKERKIEQCISACPECPECHKSNDTTYIVVIAVLAIAFVVGCCICLCVGYLAYKYNLFRHRNNENYVKVPGNNDERQPPGGPGNHEEEPPQEQ